MIVCCLVAFPVFGLTFFHIGLISWGRTTNEQVTGKVRRGFNPFNSGCWGNWEKVFCSPIQPSHMHCEKLLERSEVNGEASPQDVRFEMEMMPNHEMSFTNTRNTNGKKTDSISPPRTTTVQTPDARKEPSPVPKSSPMRSPRTPHAASASPMFYMPDRPSAQVKVYREAEV